MTSPYDAIIVNYNGAQVLGPTLDALLKANPAPATIIVFDNNSVDNSREVLHSYPQVEVIHSSKNHGFAYGNNRAAEKASSPYLLFLNNDLKVTPNCPRLLLEFLESHTDCAIANPLIYRGWDEKSSAVYSFGAFTNTAGFNFDNLTPERQNTQSYNGACFMARRDVWQKFPMEEHFFLYYEEPEQSIRLRQAGFTIGSTAEAVAYHLVSFSSPKDPVAGMAFRQFYGIQNRWFSIGRHWPARLLPIAFILNWLHLTIYVLFFIRHKQWRYLSLIFLAPYQFFLGVGKRLSSPPPKNNRWYRVLRPSQVREMLSVGQKVIHTS